MAEDEVKQTAWDEAAEKVTEGTATEGEAANAEKAAAAEDAGHSGGEASKEEAVAGDAAEEKKEVEPLEDIDTEWEAEKYVHS